MPDKKYWLGYYKRLGFDDKESERLASSRVPSDSGADDLAVTREPEEPLGFMGGLGRGVSETGASYAGALSDIALGERTALGRAFERTATGLADEEDQPELTGAGKVGRVIGRFGSEIAGTMLGGGLGLKAASKIPAVARALQSGGRAARAGATALGNLPIDYLQAKAYGEGAVLPGFGGALAENVALSGAFGGMGRGTRAVTDETAEAARAAARDQLSLGAVDTGSGIVKSVRETIPQQLETDLASTLRQRRATPSIENFAYLEKQGKGGFARQAASLNYEDIVRRYESGTAAKTGLSEPEIERVRYEHGLVVSEYKDVRDEISRLRNIVDDPTADPFLKQEAVADIEYLEDTVSPHLYRDMMVSTDILSNQAREAGLSLRLTRRLPEIMRDLGVTTRHEYENIVKKALNLRSLKQLSEDNFDRFNAITLIQDEATKRAELADFIKSIAKADKISVLFDSRRAGLLSSLTSVLRNVVGGAEIVLSSAIERPIAYAIDRVINPGGPVFGRYNPLTEAIDFSKGFAKGARRAWNNKEALIRGADIEDPLKTASRNLAYESAFGDAPKPLRAALRFWNNANNFIYGAVAGPDLAFRQGVLNKSIKERALLRTLREVGPDSKDFNTIFRKYLEGAEGKYKDALAEDIVFATFDSLDQTLKTKTGFGRLVSGIQREGGPLGRVTEFLIPFPNTPTNIVRKALERLPGVGLAVGSDYEKILLNHVNDMRKQGYSVTKEGIDNELKRLKAQLYAKQITGSAAAYAGYMLYKNGKMTAEYAPPIGASPEEREAAKQRELTGESPLSLRFGDKTYSLASLGTIAPLLAVGAAMAAAEEDAAEPTAGEFLGAGARSALRTTLEMPLLTGAREAIEALEGRGMTKRAAAGRQLGTFIPFSGGLRALSYAMEDVGARKPETFTEGLVSGLPILSKKAPARVTSLGETLPVTDRIERLVQPYTPKKMVSGPLYEALDLIDFAPSVPAKMSGETYAEFSERRQREGVAEREMLNRVLSSFAESYDMNIEEMAQDEEVRNRLRAALERALSRTRSFQTRQARRMPTNE